MFAIIGALSALAAGLENNVSEALSELAEIAQTSAKESILYKGNTLRSAIVIIDNGSYSKTVLADKDYAFYVEEGNNQRGPYIYPVRAKALHFYYNGSEVFAKRVRAHGPIPFMKTAKELAESKAEEVIAKHLGLGK